MKKCSTCLDVKPLEAFYKNSRTLDGFFYQCKACQNAYTKKWVANHPNSAKRKKSTDIWRAKNPHKVREKDARYYAKYADQIKSQKSVYRKTHPEAIAAARHRYRARKRNAPGAHTAQDIQDLFLLQQSACAMCHQSFVKVKSHVDHIMPLALGGSNDKTNLQLLCAQCNLRKSSKHPVIFAQQMGFLL